MPLIVLAMVFGVFALGLIILLIYKSILTRHENDQLFLDDTSSHMHEEQTELLAKVNLLVIPVRMFSIGSGVFLKTGVQTGKTVVMKYFRASDRMKRQRANVAR
jgi:hypothetical protein